MRITQSDPRLPTIERGQPIEITVDGQPMTAYRGETIAAVLFAEGQRMLRRTPQLGQPRSIFCGMGVCFDCLVTVDGIPHIRACETPVVAGMVIETKGE